MSAFEALTGWHGGPVTIGWVGKVRAGLVKALCCGAVPKCKYLMAPLMGCGGNGTC